MNKPEGMEKRGVVAYGWTPPAGSSVDTTKGKTWRDCKKAAGSNVEDLDSDFTKRAAEASRKKPK